MPFNLHRALIHSFGKLICLPIENFPEHQLRLVEMIKEYPKSTIYNTHVIGLMFDVDDIFIIYSFESSNICEGFHTRYLSSFVYRIRIVDLGYSKILKQ